jgi:endonuclease G
VPDPTPEQLQKIFDQVVKTYSHRENVTGVDVGFRYDKGLRTNEMAVRIHVREKIPEHALEADEVFPKSIDGVPIDVIQAVYTPHAQPAVIEPDDDTIDRRLRFDPVQPGISIGHESVTAGTLGAIVFDRRTSQRGILSNWHVLAGSNAARPGDPIVQPGPKHGGRAPQDTIARLERFLLDEHGDAAFAILNASRDVSDVQLATGVRVTNIRRVRIGDIVTKSGRTTAVTRGLVEGIGQYTLTYAGVGSKTIAGFKVVAEEDGNPGNLEISAGGDSGSLWFAVADQNGVGVHFAGETDPAPGEEHALACHLDDVLTQLDVTLEPTGLVPPSPNEPQAALTGFLAPSSADLTVLLSESVVRLSRVLELVTGSSVLVTPSPRARRTRTRSTRTRRHGTK